MKIENNGPEHSRRAQLSANEASSVDGARPSSSEASSPAHNRDEAVLSAQARALGRARAALAEVPEIRAERVSAVRAQIESGTYRIPYDQLAGRLLRSAAYG